MELIKVDLAETKSFSSFFLEYLQGKDTLKSLYAWSPSREGFAPCLENRRSFPVERREILVKSLQDQYAGIEIKAEAGQNLKLLGKPNTFTVTTGHQLNLATGPLYFAFKIITVINACRELKKLHPQDNFVPVYWMAAEDHDYEEIKSFRLFGQTYTWDTQQQGAVGRFSTAGIAAALPDFGGMMQIFKSAYTKNKTLSAAVRDYVNELFGSFGLVVVDGDDARLKRLLEPVMHADIQQGKVKPIVEQANDLIRQAGHEPQIFCRDINFFYLKDDLRSRIERTETGFKVVDTTLHFSEAELQQEINQHPERFSPNVILRPLYQEILLPNLGYVGGPAEMVYWLQLKGVFDFFGESFPVLLPRNFGVIADHTVVRKFSKTGLSPQELFEPENFLINRWVLKNSTRDLSVSSEMEMIQAEMLKLQQKSLAIDPTLQPFAEGISRRIETYLDRLGQKMLRAERRQHEDRIRQIKEIKAALFPGGGLQERKDNLMNFALNDPEFIPVLVDHFDPFDFRFYMFFNDQA